jgi:hypothetical protein
MTNVRFCFAAALAASLAAVAWGCAAGSSEADAPPKPAPAPTHSQHSAQSVLSTATEFCSARAEAECSSAVVTACQLAGKSACVRARSKSCMSAVPQGTTYQPAKAPACLDAVKSVYATSSISAEALAELDPVCGSDLFAGPGAARAPCMTDYDCDSAKGLQCVMPNPPTGTSMGQCFVPQVTPPGGDCSVQGSVCGTNTYCDPTGLTCVADAQLNEGCNPPGYPCAAGLQCAGAGLPVATCAAASPDGAACNASTECTSGLCDKATDQAGGTCTSTITLTALDSLCDSFK